MSDPKPSSWEYQLGTCDLWQLAQLCNRFAENGWDVVQVVAAYPGVAVPHQINKPDGATYEAVKAMSVLFRRPLGHADDPELNPADPTPAPTA